jgi:hypothetical protein
MPYIFDTTANPNVDPAYGDKIPLGDVSDTTNNANGDTKTTTIQQIMNHIEINAQTGTTYTLVLGDRAKMITMNNASANTLTVPLNSSVAFPVGTSIIIRQTGAGVTTIDAVASVTLDGVSGGQCAITTRYKAAVITKVATDTWYVDGAVGSVV